MFAIILMNIISGFNMKVQKFCINIAHININITLIKFLIQKIQLSTLPYTAGWETPISDINVKVICI